MPWYPRPEWVAVFAVVALGGFMLLAREHRRRMRCENERLEGVIRERTRELKEAHDATFRFLAHLSHEIRTPMNGVIGIAQELELTCEDLRRREHASTIRRSGEFLLEIVDDVLAMGRIEAGGIELEQVPLNVAEVLEDCILLLRDTARAKALDLRLDISPTVPADLKGDPTRLRQILINLISNAVKFTKKGFVEVAVEAEAGADGEAKLRFIVRDTGLGIPAGARKRIFEPFRQADASTTRLYGGSGLGLAIAKQLVDLHGGSIDVDSVEGEGTTFIVSITFDRSSERESTMQKRDKGKSVEGNGAGRGEHSAPEQRDARILIAEDNPVNQRVCSIFLRRGGFESEIARDGRETLEKVASGRFDLVLMDMRMPGMDGIEATKAIRAGEAGHLFRSIPIIGVSAATDREGCERFSAAGINARLGKPLSMDDLLSAVQETLAAAADADGKAGH
ncbi:MAG: response regulator [Opitutales bacterium]|nr:response regulator [Opitutales bacterium]